MNKKITTVLGITQKPMNIIKKNRVSSSFSQLNFWRELENKAKYNDEKLSSELINYKKFYRKHKYTYVVTPM